MTEVRWLVTAAETEGRLARAELRVPPGGGEATHAHPDGEERLELLAGSRRSRWAGAASGSARATTSRSRPAFRTRGATPGRASWTS